MGFHDKCLPSQCLYCLGQFLQLVKVCGTIVCSNDIRISSCNGQVRFDIESIHPPLRGQFAVALGLGIIQQRVKVEHIMVQIGLLCHQDAIVLDINLFKDGVRKIVDNGTVVSDCGVRDGTGVLYFNACVSSCVSWICQPDLHLQFNFRSS